MGQKRFGRIDGVAVLPGQAQISWLEKYTYKYIFWTTILINKQP